MTGGLARLVERAAAHDIVLHSLEVSVAGRLVHSAASDPHGPHVPHRMYSVAKSLTGLAILGLAHDGALRLDDPVAAHLPEFGPVHDLVARTTIADVLSMRGPHARTTYREGEPDWLASYFRVPPTHAPGTIFTYDTSGSYVLSAIAERAHGAPLKRVLRERLFAPLGAGDDLRVLRGPDGVGHGGSGLVCRPRDLLAIAEMLVGGGARGGVRVLPAEVVEQAIARRSDPSMQTWGGPLRAGYGAQIWLPPGGGWMMFGLGGQIVYGDPSRELAVVVTANAQGCQAGDQRLVSLLLEALEEDPRSQETPSLAPPDPPHDAAYARRIDGSFSLVAGEGAPDRIRVSAGAERAVVEASEARFEAEPGRTTAFAREDGRGTIAAGWTAPGALELRADLSGDDILRRRVRLVRTDDGLVSVQAQGFGPAASPRDDWFGCYAPTSS